LISKAMNSELRHHTVIAERYSLPSSVLIVPSELTLKTRDQVFIQPPVARVRWSSDDRHARGLRTFFTLLLDERHCNP
jgi:hypothetical protein